MISRSRRQFLASLTVAGMATRRRNVYAQRRPEKIRFAVIGLNHPHINAQVDAVIRGGGELVSFFAREPNLATTFGNRYPTALRVSSQREILDDETVQLVVSAAIPNERASLGISVMRHGKDFMVDKPGATSLEQLAQIRRVQAQTKRIFSVLVGRHESPSVMRAAELVSAGVIGRVVQTAALAPHRLNAESRPSWFFERERAGGIRCDLATHSIDEFLFFTKSTEATVVAAQAGNINHPEFPKIEDFGDVMLRGNRGTGYARVDWFTPGGLRVFGDGRLTILGTDGYIEIRKYVDIEGRAAGDHLFLVDQRETRYINCSDVALDWPQRLVNDVLNRTETANPQTQTFLAMELALAAQEAAQRLGTLTSRSDRKGSL